MRALTFILLLFVTFASAEDAEFKERKQAAKAIAKKLASRNDEEILAGLLKAALNQDPALTSPLIRLLKNKNTAVRYGVIETLAARELAGEQKHAARALAARLKPLSAKETNKEELLKVISALHDLAQPSTIKVLLDSKSTEDRDIRQARAMAVANVPDKEAIERLIQYGYKDRRGASRTRDIAAKALRYATGAQIKGGLDAWHKWWSENKRSFDPMDAAEQRAAKRSAAAASASRKRDRKKGKRKK